ncbi:inner-membrane translocator [Streptomyces sp. AC495_CC817]|uniref:inner-membrane translocator n=1 Tax=Streptomyces sp. AC495_CC817 TaxID=2823900 RepID=UPI001C275DAA|nr:inner-membrane translocator [Streptomyces sp. AC495_CC817]
MPEPTERQSSDKEDLLTSGCLLLLVLLADAGAALVVAILLAARGLGRKDTAYLAGEPPVDWMPVLGFSALTLVVAVTAVMLLRIGHQAIGTVQLTLGVFLAVYTLGYWP